MMQLRQKLSSRLNRFRSLVSGIRSSDEEKKRLCLVVAGGRREVDVFRWYAMDPPPNSTIAAVLTSWWQRFGPKKHAPPPPPQTLFHEIRCKDCQIGFTEVSLGSKLFHIGGLLRRDIYNNPFPSLPAAVKLIDPASGGVSSDLIPMRSGKGSPKATLVKYNFLPYSSLTQHKEKNAPSNAFHFQKRQVRMFGTASSGGEDIFLSLKDVFQDHIFWEHLMSASNTEIRASQKLKDLLWHVYMELEKLELYGNRSKLTIDNISYHVKDTKFRFPKITTEDSPPTLSVGEVLRFILNSDSLQTPGKYWDPETNDFLEHLKNGLDPLDHYWWLSSPKRCAVMFHLKNHYIVELSKAGSCSQYTVFTNYGTKCVLNSHYETPCEDLRKAQDMHVAFRLACNFFTHKAEENPNPYIYMLEEIENDFFHQYPDFWPQLHKVIKKGKLEGVYRMFF